MTDAGHRRIPVEGIPVDAQGKPFSGLKGYRSANAELAAMLRGRNGEAPPFARYRPVLDRLVRESGLQGAPALKYLAATMRYRLGDRSVPTPPKELTPAERLFIERRAGELLDTAHRELPELKRNG